MSDSQYNPVPPPHDESIVDAELLPIDRTLPVGGTLGKAPVASDVVVSNVVVSNVGGEIVEAQIVSEVVGQPRAVPTDTLSTDTLSTSPFVLSGSRSKPSIPRRIVLGVKELVIWMVGMSTLTAGLAALSSVPILQFISLGYLFDATGRIARSGRFRDGFIGYRSAARVGTVAIGLWLTLIPIRLFANFSHSALVVDPGGNPAIVLRFVLAIVTIALSLHATVAVYCGGRLRDFFYPFLIPYSILSLVWRRESMRNWFPPVRIWSDFRGGILYQSAAERLWAFIEQLKLLPMFWIGLQGYLLTFVWIGLPGLIMAGTLTGDVAAPLLFFGGVAMAIVVMYVPILQAHFAAERNWRAMLQWKEARALFTRAPFAMLVSITLTFTFAIPLYLAKLEATSRELTWIPNLLFIVSILPGRWVAGWAMARARRRKTQCHWLSRLVARVLIASVAVAYVVMISLAALNTWDGGWSLLRQHAFLIPAAFLETR
jgi:hypothetical protein